jgi:hypothetical protein
LFLRKKYREINEKKIENIKRKLLFINVFELLLIVITVVACIIRAQLVVVCAHGIKGVIVDKVGGNIAAPPAHG